MPPRAGEPKTIRIEELIPVPPELAAAAVDHRAVYWRLIGGRALAVKKAEVLEGVGADGEPLLPVQRRQGGPPLIPHRANSRTYRLLALAARADGASLYWRSGGGRTTWPTILGYHAYIHGPRSLPVRNTIGISPEGTRKVMAESETWRAGYKAGRDAALKEVITGSKVKAKDLAPRVRTVTVKETKVEREARARAEAEARRTHAPLAAVQAARAAPAPAVAPPPTPAHVTRRRIEAYQATTEKLDQVRRIGSAATLMEARRDLAAARMETLLSELKGAKGAERRRIQAELDAAGREHERADLEASRLKREARAKVLNALLIEDKNQRLGVKVQVDPAAPIGKEVSDSAVGALNFVSHVVAHAGGPSVRVKLAAIPLDEEQRAHHLGGKDGLIRLGNQPNPKVLIHEMGHLLEDQVPGWAARAREFLDYRAGDEKTRLLQDVLDKRYDKHEKGRKDKFDQAFGDAGWYVGKEYKHKATEITSMAIEKLFEDPVTFAAKDPEYFAWIVGMLDGGLR